MAAQAPLHSWALHFWALHFCPAAFLGSAFLGSTFLSSCISGLQTCSRLSRPAQPTRWLRGRYPSLPGKVFYRQKLYLTSSCLCTCLKPPGNGPEMLKGQILPPCAPTPAVRCAALQKPKCSSHWDGLCHASFSFRKDARNTFSRAASPSQRMKVLSQQPWNLLTLPQGSQEGSQALDFHSV